MFKHIQLGEHAGLIAIVAFAVTATIFLSCVRFALRMHRDDVNRFAGLPLEPDSDKVSHDSQA